MRWIIAALMMAVVCISHATPAEVENQPIPDQGDGHFLNPIFPGDYGDPSIVRRGDDYYAAFSRSSGMMIWHSRDLVNWKPLVHHRLPAGYDRIWAVDLQYFDGKFHLYLPIGQYPGKTEGRFACFVISAESPAGPWSEPVNLNLSKPEKEDPDPDLFFMAIDPGFVETPEGERYLFVNHGYVARLNQEGNRAVSTPQIVYRGWKYPEDWVVTGFCLESPKLFRRGDFYYMISAEGGTNGPSTAHMAIAARAKHPLGPWENSPHNPIIRTRSQDEAFWHQGHGTIFQAKGGEWYMIYHGRLNNYETMGRPTLLIPIDWTGDGWPIARPGVAVDQPIEMPMGDKLTAGLPLSDDFTQPEIGMQWEFDSKDKEHIDVGEGRLSLEAKGEASDSAMTLWQRAVNPSFEVQVEVKIEGDGGVGGLRLGTQGIQFDGHNVFFSEITSSRHRHAIHPVEGGKVWLKIRNDRKDIAYFYSVDGKNWHQFADSSRDPESYRIMLYAFGKESAEFRNFRYRGMDLNSN